MRCGQGLVTTIMGSASASLGSEGRTAPSHVRAAVLAERGQELMV